MSLGNQGDKTFKIEFDGFYNGTGTLFRRDDLTNSYVSIEEGTGTPYCTAAFNWLNVIYQNGTQQHRNAIYNLDISVANWWPLT